MEGGGVAEAMARGIRITLQAGGQVWNKCGVEGGGVAEAMARGIRIRLQARRAGMEGRYGTCGLGKLGWRTILS